MTYVVNVEDVIEDISKLPGGEKNSDEIIGEILHIANQTVEECAAKIGETREISREAMVVIAEAGERIKSQKDVIDYLLYLCTTEESVFGLSGKAMLQLAFGMTNEPAYWPMDDDDLERLIRTYELAPQAVKPLLRDAFMRVLKLGVKQIDGDVPTQIVTWEENDESSKDQRITA